MNKDEFATLCNRFERDGMLPRGKTAELLDSYDFVVQRIADEAKADAEANAAALRPTEPDHDVLDEKARKRAKNA